MMKSDLSNAIVFDIQRFSIHDGPGIRTTIFFKGCPLRCVWCQNPESHAMNPEIAFYSESCGRCFACRAVCPKNAITTDNERRIDYALCDACGACAQACPTRSLRLIGRKWDCDELVAEVLKDKDFFVDSGGGVTLSGGEPMMYPHPVGQLLRRLKKEKISTVIETCGMFPWQAMTRVAPFVDIVYFDLKTMDNDAHRRFTGADNFLILENFKKLSRVCKNVQARMPVIPGFNDSTANIRATARFLKSQKERTIHCLPYRNLGEAKIRRIHTTLAPLGIAGRNGKDLANVKALFKKEGIDAIIYD